MFNKATLVLSDDAAIMLAVAFHHGYEFLSTLERANELEADKAKAAICVLCRDVLRSHGFDEKALEEGGNGQ